MKFIHVLIAHNFSFESTPMKVAANSKRFVDCGSKVEYNISKVGNYKNV